MNAHILTNDKALKNLLVDLLQQFFYENRLLK